MGSGQLRMHLSFTFTVSFANEAADPRGSAVELANHRAVREYRRKISSQRKGLFLTIFGYGRHVHVCVASTAWFGCCFSGRFS